MEMETGTSGHRERERSLLPKLQAASFTWSSTLSSLVSAALSSFAGDLNAFVTAFNHLLGFAFPMVVAVGWCFLAQAESCKIQKPSWTSSWKSPPRDWASSTKPQTETNHTIAKLARSHQALNLQKDSQVQNLLLLLLLLLLFGKLANNPHKLWLFSWRFTSANKCTTGSNQIV